MRKVFVIGIGAGDPGHLTAGAIAALNAADVLFVLEKSDEQHELTELRQTIIDRFVDGPARVVVAQTESVRGRKSAAGAYGDTIADWRAGRAGVCERLIAEELADDDTGAFLVWGDPSLYDSTLTLLDGIRERVAFEVTVVPGISAVAALAASHRLVLNRVGGAVQITTGRRLEREGMTADDVVVMLDGDQAFTKIDPAGIDIHWGAYLGSPDEVLVAGPLEEVAEGISAVRAEARERKGWIFDTYLLRRRRD